MVDTPYTPGGHSTRSSGAGHRSAPLRMLEDRTQQFLRARLEIFFRQVWDEFFELSDNTDNVALQTQYLDTMMATRLEKAAIETAFLELTTTGYSELANVTEPTSGNAVRGDISGGLKLLGNEELEEIIAFDVIVSRVQNKCALLLDRLARRLGHVQNGQIKPRALPLSPEQLCDNFLRAVRRASGGSQALIALLKSFDRSVLAELENFLGESNELLKGLGILPGLEDEKANAKGKVRAARIPQRKSRRASDLDDDEGEGEDSVEPFTATPRNGTPGTGRSGPEPFSPERFSPERSSPERSGAAAPNTENPGARKHGFTQRVRQNAARAGAVSQLVAALQIAAGTSGRGKAGVGNGAGEQGEVGAKGGAALLDVLSEIRSQGKTRTRPKGGADSAGADRIGVRRQVEEHFASQGREFKDLHPVDQTALELLDLLFAQWQQQDWVPGVLGELLQQVELPVAGIAMADPGFFDREQHPARRLLNEMSRAASSFVQLEQVPGTDPVYQKINEVVAALGEMQADTRQLSELLSEFIACVETDRRRLAALEQRVLEEESATERINAAHTQVEKLLRARLEGKQLPLVVIDFVESAWCRVLFLSYLKYGLESDQWRGGVQLLDQLLGLIQSESSVGGERLRKVLDIIRETLDDAGYDAYQASQFLRGIAGFFDRDRRREPETTAMPVVLQLNEARESGNPFALVVAGEITADLPGAAQYDSDEMAPLVDDDCLSQVDSIKKGSWVEFREEGEATPRRCRMIGVIRPTGKLIFGDRNGKKVAEGHRYRMAVMMKQGNLVVLDNSHLFDDAMAQVVDDFRQRCARTA